MNLQNNRWYARLFADRHFRRMQASDSPSNRSVGHIPALNGIRGFAILVVMLFHTGIQTFVGGFIGVDVFFVLSGFLITSLLVKEFDRLGHINLKNFYLRRILRLAPAFILLLLAVNIASLLLLNRTQIKYTLIDSLIALFYLSNWSWAFDIHRPNLLAHAWSLSIEEQFYLLWPLILMTLLRHIRSRWRIVAVIFFCALAAWLLRIFLLTQGATFERVYTGLDTRADALLLGCGLGVLLSSNLLSDRWRNRLAQILPVLTPCCLLSLLYLCFTIEWHNLQLYYWLFFVIELLVAIIILDVFVAERSLVQRILGAKFLTWVGNISYGLYLWHYVVYKAIRILHGNEWQVLIIGSCLTFFIAILSYRYLERPFLQIKNRFRTSTDGPFIFSRVNTLHK